MHVAREGILVGNLRKSVKLAVSGGGRPIAAAGRGGAPVNAGGRLGRVLGGRGAVICFRGTNGGHFGGITRRGAVAQLAD